MLMDCHIHITEELDPPELFKKKLELAGVGGGIVLSYHPASFDNKKTEKDSARHRIAQVMDFTNENPNLYPFFFIDPLEDGAAEQVDLAVEAGISGFKVICCHHYPQDDKAMKIWEYIAKKDKPILFHSGILYNYGPSAEYNRPGNFEHLFYIENLRFALAHISWPWCDELISVFGKWNYLYAEAGIRGIGELFIDLTPGTPPIYREEALRKLLTVGYEMMPSHMLFGTDGSSVYNSEKYRQVIENDIAIYDKLGVPTRIKSQIFQENLLRFIHR